MGLLFPAGCNKRTSAQAVIRALGTWLEGSGQFRTLASIIIAFNQQEETNQRNAAIRCPWHVDEHATLLLRLALPLLPYLPDLPPPRAEWVLFPLLFYSFKAQKRPDTTLLRCPVVCFGNNSAERLRAKLLELVSSSLEAGHSVTSRPVPSLCQQAPQTRSASGPKTTARMNCSDRRRARLVSHTESSAERLCYPAAAAVAKQGQHPAQHHGHATVQATGRPATQGELDPPPLVPRRHRRLS